MATGNEEKYLHKLLELTFGRFNGNLDMIKDSVRNLQEDNNSFEAGRQLKKINLLTSNIQNTLNDLAELTRFDKNEVRINKEKNNVVTFLNNFAERFRGRLTIDLSIDTSVEGEAFVDREKLVKIFYNLLKFFAYSSKSGVIKISADYNGLFNFIISSDTGAIEPDILENLFEPYKLLQSGDLKRTDISGLSLTLTKKYVELLKGNIKAGSQGEMTNISFSVGGEKMSDIENTVSSLPKPGATNNILVIQDDFAVSRLMKSYLTDWGYSPVVVNTAGQALDIVKKERFLAILLDIEIPDYNGLELLKKFHEMEETKNIPVIVSSVRPEEQKAYMLGAVEYFQKPINYNFLVEVLTNYKLKRNSKVLCVDDDIPTVNLVKSAIENAGYIAVAENVSAKVLERIKGQNIDLAIIDLDMPYPNGFELIKLIKSEPEHEKLPIIIYTGKDNYEEDLKQIDGLFEDLLDKRSVNIEDLRDTISSMIGRYDTPPPKEEVFKKQDVQKILLAEDYKHSQIIVTRLLKKNGYENIVVVENGQEALDMAAKEHFSLILMDMQMPVMNGFEATRKIREINEYADTPIIALTAFAMKGDREKCISAGASDYIPKPIDSKEFIDKINSYLNKD